MNNIKYTINPDGTVNSVTTDDKSEIRRKLQKFKANPELSEDMQDYDDHKLFK